MKHVLVSGLGRCVSGAVCVSEVLWCVICVVLDSRVK